MQFRLSSKILALALLCLAAAPALAATPEALSGRLSGNWAGYVATRGGYSGVGATWTVPTLAATTTLMTDVTWVGIGGSKSKDLIQAGTHNAVQNGRTQYWAWYELLPDYQTVIPLAVKGGDKVEVSLTEVSPDLWYLSFSNETTGKRYGRVLEYRSKHSSVEWIEEMPVVYGRDGDQAYAPLSEFGTVAFSDAYAVVDGERRSIDASRPSAVSMVSKQDKRVLLAAPGDIQDGGFAVVRSGAVPSPAPQGGRRSRANAYDIVWSR